MEESLLNLALKDGIWATLFVVLFIYTLADSRKREQKLQQVIDENQKIIADALKKMDVIENIHDDVQMIKSEVTRR